MSTYKKSFAPTSLRLLLAFLLIAIAALMAIGFVYSYGELSKYAVEVSHVKADALASNDSLQVLQNTQQELKKNQGAIVRSTSLTATGELPQFEAMNNIRAYASRNNLTLKSIDLVDKAGPATSQAPAAAPAPASTTGNTIDVNVTFTDEVNYKNFLQFLSDIENSVPKMQVKGINISKGADITMIKTGPLTIQMYVN